MFSRFIRANVVHQLHIASHTANEQVKSSNMNEHNMK